MDHNLYGPEHVEAKTKAEKKRLFVLNLILMLISHLKVISLTITVIIACRFLVKKKKKNRKWNIHLHDSKLWYLEYLFLLLMLFLNRNLIIISMECWLTLQRDSLHPYLTGNASYYSLLPLLLLFLSASSVVRDVHPQISRQMPTVSESFNLFITAESLFQSHFTMNSSLVDISFKGWSWNFQP